jgi:eukaryotic-like serine/threonine-protein kinase
MNQASHDRIAELFERLVDLADADRESLLSGLAPATSARLRKLLAADSDPRDPLVTVMSAAVHCNDVLPGQRLGAWRVLSELGAGGMGTVVLAERADGQYTQQAAIKLIRGFPTEDGKRRLRMERQILAELDHPNIARLLDGGETADGQPYVAMEYVAGVDLLDHIATHKLTLPQRLDLFDRIADAVQHAHQRLVIHRDLKPGNVLVRSDGEPKLLDFGVAKLIDVSIDSDARHTSTRVWTPSYASPEQKQGKPVTTTTDVYSLGVMLREMLTGERAIVDNDTTPLSRTSRLMAIKVDAELRGIIAMASADQSTQRYPSVEALREDLRRYREGRPLRAARDSAWYRLRKFLRRHRAAAAVAAVVIATLALFVWRLDVERNRALAAEADAKARGAAAQRSAATAQRTLDYVINIFNAANPQRTQGRAMTPRMLVDEAAAQLQSRLGDEPEAKRWIHLVLGEFYNELGEPAPAIAILEPALVDAPVTSRDEALFLARADDALAIALSAENQPDKASAALLRGAQLRETWAAKDPLEMIEVVRQRAKAAYHKGDLDTARSGFQAALTRARAEPTADAEIIDEMLMYLSDIPLLQGDFPAAELASAELLTRAEAHLPELSVGRIRAVKMRASVLTGLGRYDEAEALLRRAISNYERLVGAHGTTFADILNNLAITLNERGRFREAAELMLRSLALEQEASEPGAKVDPLTLMNLGSIQESAGDYVASVATMQRAIEVLHDRHAPERTQQLKADANFARTLALAGRIEEARSLMQSVVAARKAAGKDSEFEWALETYRLGQIERLAGHLDTATQLLDVASPVMEQTLPAGHPALAWMLVLRGRIALDRKDFDRASRELDAARVMLVAAKALPIDLAFVDVRRAGAAAGRGDAHSARAILMPALDILRDQVLPTEQFRAEGERLARRLTLRPPPKK